MPTRKSLLKPPLLNLSAEVEALGEATADLLAETETGLDPIVYRELRNEFYRLCPPVLEFYRRLDRVLAANDREDSKRRRRSKREWMGARGTAEEAVVE